jgi:hypothetical protein
MIKTSRGKWFSIPHYGSCEAINAASSLNREASTEAKKKKNAARCTD